MRALGSSLANVRYFTDVSAAGERIMEMIKRVPKVPDFLKNVSQFIGSYIVAFISLWRLALVGFPFIVLLVILGFMYKRTLMGLARKIKQDYNQVGTIAKQAISSIRIVYSFVGETRTIAAFFDALEGSVKLGLKQGLAKSLVIGVSGVNYAIDQFFFH
ncbi:hypothetical protein RYX36_033224 [Vicia faba]